MVISLPADAVYPLFFQYEGAFMERGSMDLVESGAVWKILKDVAGVFRRLEAPQDSGICNKQQV